jgi:hypothetical protein
VIRKSSHQLFYEEQRKVKRNNIQSVTSFASFLEFFLLALNKISKNFILMHLVIGTPKWNV